MKVFSGIIVGLSLIITPAYAEEQHFFYPDGEMIIPSSSIEKPAEAGKLATTSLILFKPNQRMKNGLPLGETPASIACIYGLTKFVPGCLIENTKALPTGGWGTIAVVDAYHNPNAENDLNVFSAQFGLPACTIANGCFEIVHVGASTPPFDPGWADETVLDIEWSHAMAPNAKKLILVEAASGSMEDLFQAVDLAGNLVSAAGGGVVSSSWSFPEFAGETTYDYLFQKPNVVFIASSGDYSAPARYPAASPYVIAAGGTTIIRTDGKQGDFVGEQAWSTEPNTPPGEKSGGSGGPSLYEKRPSYQNIVQKIVGNTRGNPDIAFDANPHSGVLVYSTFHGGWLIDGGTSVSSPSLAGIINAANKRAASTTDELTMIYAGIEKNYSAYWHDILQGNNGYPCLVGYDFVTGIGSPLGYNGK